MAVEFQDVARHLKSVFPQREAKVETTNAVFRIFTKLTPTVLLLSAGLIFFQRVTKDHINCHAPPDNEDDEDDDRLDAVNQYCFITGTYTVTSYPSNLKSLSNSLPYPGVGPSKSEGTEIKYHLYYQWVPFILAIQAIFFILPSFIWKLLEKGKLASYCGDLRKSFLVSSNPSKSEQKEDNDSYHITPEVYFTRNLKHHKHFSVGYVICEILNLLFLIASFILADTILAGDFAHFGTDWLDYAFKSQNETDIPKRSASQRFTHLDKEDPFNRIFPKMSKCEFKRYGPGGGLINYDILCVMTLNVIHEKIFLLFWFWFLILMVIQALVLLYRLALFCSKRFRCKILEWRLEEAFFECDKNLTETERTEKFEEFKKKLKEHVGKRGFADWFMLYRIVGNMERGLATRFLQRVVPELKKHDCKCANQNKGDDQDDAEKYEGNGIPMMSIRRNRNDSHGSHLGSVYEHSRSLLQLQEEHTLLDSDESSRGTKRRQQFQQQLLIDIPDGTSVNGDNTE